MSSPEHVEQQLRAAARSWPGAGGDEPASLSPDRRTGLVAELRRRRMRRVGTMVATAGVIVAGALALVVVPGSGGPAQRSAAPIHTPAANEPSSGSIACVTLRISDGTRQCAGTLRSSLPVVAPSAAFGTAAHAAETTATVHVEVGNQVAIALPSAPGLQWTAVAASPLSPAVAQGRSLSTAPSPAGPLLTTVSHHRGHGGGATTTFRAVRAGTVVLTASASGPCPAPKGASCPAPGAHWQVVVTISSGKRSGTS